MRFRRVKLIYSGLHRVTGVEPKEAESKLSFLNHHPRCRVGYTKGNIKYLKESPNSHVGLQCGL